MTVHIIIDDDIFFTIIIPVMLVFNVRAAVPWSIGQLLAVLTVPFLTANNELLLLLRWVRPEWMMTGAVPLFAGQMCLLRFVQLSELPKGLPLAAGVLVLCMVLQLSLIHIWNTLPTGWNAMWKLLPRSFTASKRPVNELPL